MIEKIKVEIAERKKSFLREEYFVLKDITKTVAMPIIDNETIDETLDTTQIVIYNKKKDPFMPFTRFIITLYEGGEEHRIYRYLDSDDVEQKTFGKKPIYCHKINLIEITKILEREPVANLSFTNYLNSDTGDASYSMKIINNGGVYGIFSYNSSSYTSSARFPKTAIIGDIISSKVRLKPICSTMIVAFFMPLVWQEYEVPFNNAYFISPSGKIVDINKNEEIVLNEVGDWTIVQNYFIHEIYGTSLVFSKKIELANLEYKWTISVKENEYQPDKDYTVAEVCDRLLKCYETRQEEVQQQKFILDATLYDKLDKIKSPEFNFTNSTLFEALNQIGGYIHAIPRLIPQVIKNYDENGNEDGTYNDYSNWNTITFDFFDNKEIIKDNCSFCDSTVSSNNYLKGVVTEVQNGLQSSYNTDSTIVEPYETGYVSTRTESGNFEITNDNFCIKTLMPIRALKELLVCHQGQTYDITQFVVNEKKYQTFKSYESNNSFESRFGYLYYTEGQNNIKGCDFQKEASWVIDNLANKYKNSLDFILRRKVGDDSISFFTDASDYSYRIKYIPYLNFNVKQVRYLVDENMPDIYGYYNQSANIVDIEALGENTRGVLARTSSVENIITSYYKKCSKIPKLGQFIQGGYKCFSVSKELITNAPIKATTKWTKNYEKLNDNVSYKKAIREYEVSENECFNRNVPYSEYLIISDKFDLADYYTLKSYDFSFTGENTEMQTIIENELNKCRIGRDKVISTMCYRLWGDMEVSGDSTNPDDDLPYADYPTNISYAYIQTLSDDGEVISSFVLPTAIFPYGNSVVLLTKLQDNYSAASYVTTEGIHSLEDYVEYGDPTGRFDKLKIAYGNKSPYQTLTSDSSEITTRAKQLYKFEDAFNENDVVIDFRDYAFMVDKDSREGIAITSQLDIVTDSNNILFGKNVTNVVPYVNDINKAFKFVYFLEKPTLFDGKISSDKYVEDDWFFQLNIAIKTFAVFPYNLNKNKCLTNCVGYGMLDSEDNLIYFVDKSLNKDDEVPPIFFMFRRRI